MDPEPKPYRVGVLFVHGMGEQEQGDSVTEMGDELTEWLRKWLPPESFKIREAKLRSGGQVLSGSPDHPIGGQAHVSVTITDRSKQPPAVQEWLLAESWWAKSFRQATFPELVAWAFTAGPWLIASQRAGLENRFRAAAATGNYGVLKLLGLRVTLLVLRIVAAVVASVITPVFLALLLFSLLPIPGLQDVVKGLAKNLSGSFGDLLVLVRSPVRFAAMAEQVRSDIDDLYNRCDRVIVLAHSQGSAVSWHAIRRMADRPASVRSHIALFMSFGQAFRKLKALYRVNRSSGPDKGIFLLLATLSTILLVLAGWQGAGIVGEAIRTQLDFGTIWDRIPANVVWFGVAVAVVLLIQQALVQKAGDNDTGAEEEVLKEIREVRETLPEFRWLDLWASADPAPNGPLLTNPPSGVESYKIRNIGSTILDHAIYWSNRTVFVSAVAFAAASLAPPSPMGTRNLIPSELRKAARVRGRRVTMLLAGRVLFFTALVTALWAVRGKLWDWGAAILSWLNSLPLPDWFGTAEPSTVTGLAAAAVIVVGGLIVWLVTIKGWDAIIGADEAHFFAREPSVEWSALAIGWLLVALLLPTAVMVGLAIYLPNWSVLLAYMLLAAAAMPLVLVSLSEGGTTLDQAPGPSEPPRQDTADVV